MSIDTIALESELRVHLGDLGSSELTPNDALLLLNRSYWELLDKFPFREKEETATFETVIGQRNYAVPSPFEALQMLSILDLTSGGYAPLERAGNWEYESIRETTDDNRGKPTKYYREEAKIRLHPIPDDIYTLTIKYWTTLADLNLSGSNLLIPRGWHEMVLYGGVWRGFLRLRDYEAAQTFKNHQIALINSSVPVEAKEERDSHAAGLEVLGRDYD